jgi:hypothetical protein
LNFGSVTTGSSASQSVTVTDTGNSAVTISQIAASGTGFSRIQRLSRKRVRRAVFQNRFLFDPIAHVPENSVTPGRTYYYVATEVSSACEESAYSGEVSAVIP